MIISKKKEIHKFLNQKNFKKIFILSGKNSYFKSGANKIFDNLLVEKKTMFYFKKSFYPDIKELKVIIDRKEGEYFVGRTEFDSPDVDNEVLIPAQDIYLKTGQHLSVKIVDASDFDLYAEVVK